MPALKPMLLVLLAGADLGAGLDASALASNDERRQRDAARAPELVPSSLIDATAELVAIVSGGSEIEQAQAAWSMATYAKQGGAEKRAIALTGAIEPLVALVSGDNSGAQEAAAAALCELAFNADNQVTP